MLLRSPLNVPAFINETDDGIKRLPPVEFEKNSKNLKVFTNYFALTMY